MPRTTIFLPRDAMHKRGLVLSRDVGLSVNSCIVERAKAIVAMECE